jgi:hypothetical protein
LVLQVGAIKIRLSEITGFTVRSKDSGWATASIESAGSLVRVDYRPASRRWWNRWDPTFDGLDEELSDFPVRVLRQWESASRGSELARSWSE